MSEEQFYFWNALVPPFYKQSFFRIIPNSEKLKQMNSSFSKFIATSASIFHIIVMDGSSKVKKEALLLLCSMLEKCKVLFSSADDGLFKKSKQRGFIPLSMSLSYLLEQIHLFLIIFTEKMLSDGKRVEMEELNLLSQTIVTLFQITPYQQLHNSLLFNLLQNFFQKTFSHPQTHVRILCMQTLSRVVGDSQKGYVNQVELFLLKNNLLLHFTHRIPSQFIPLEPSKGIQRKIVFDCNSISLFGDLTSELESAIKMVSGLMENYIQFSHLLFPFLFYFWFRREEE